MPEHYSPTNRAFSYRCFKTTVGTLSKYILPDLLANVHCARLQIENAAFPVAAVFMLPAEAKAMPERMEVPASEATKQALRPYQTDV